MTCKCTSFVSLTKHTSNGKKAFVVGELPDNEGAILVPNYDLDAMLH